MFFNFCSVPVFPGDCQEAGMEHRAWGVWPTSPEDKVEKRLRVFLGLHYLVGCIQIPAPPILAVWPQTSILTSLSLKFLPLENKTCISLKEILNWLLVSNS